MTKKFNYKNIYSRLIDYFDSINVLAYVRDDIQYVDKKKNYSRSIGLQPNLNNISDDGDSLKYIPHIYICTDVFSEVTSKDDLDKAWCQTFIDFLNKDFTYQADLANELANQLKSKFKSTTMSELELKMSIIGI